MICVCIQHFALSQNEINARQVKSSVCNRYYSVMPQKSCLVFDIIQPGKLVLLNSKSARTIAWRANRDNINMQRQVVKAAIASKRMACKISWCNTTPQVRASPDAGFYLDSWLTLLHLPLQKLHESLSGSLGHHWKHYHSLLATQSGTYCNWNKV